MTKIHGLFIVIAIFVTALIAFYLGSIQNPPMETGNADGQTSVAPASVPAKAEDNIAGSQAVAGSHFTHFRVGERNVKSIYAEEGVVWVGTSGGVIRYDEATDDYRLFDVRNGLLANGVFYVGRIKGQICVGTYGGGFALYNEAEDKFVIYNVPEGLGDAFVYDMLEMPNGDIWVATWSGANRILNGDFDNPDAWQLFTVENTQNGLPNDWVYGLALGKNNEVWFATEGGLARFEEGKWSNWAHPDGLGAPYSLVKDDNKFDTDPAEVSSHHARQKIEMNLQEITTAYNPNYIVALEVDHNGVVWVGTWGAGLGRFDGNSWQNFTVKDGLPSNHIFMLHEDKQQQLWIGTSDGLARELNDEYQILTQEHGLFSNTIFSMATQPDNTLWIGSYGGVSRINKM